MRIATRLLAPGLVTLALVLAGCTDTSSPTAVPTSPNLLISGASVGTAAVSPATASVAVGSTLQLTGVAADLKGNVAAGVPFAWTTSNSAIATVSSTGVLTARAVGSVVITGQISSPLAAAYTPITGTAKITVTAAVAGAPLAPNGSQAWTLCTTAGATCSFNGLRDVRLGGPNGPYVQLTAYGTIPCATYGFNGQNPAPNQALHCDYGPPKSTTISNPSPGMSGLSAAVIVPLGSPGVAVAQTRASSGVPTYTDGSGSFRTTCSLAAFAFNDPIVFPGRPGASHLHAFFGNTGVNPSSTPQSLVAGGNSTCRGGTLNRTAYWSPAVIDSRNGQVQTPNEAVFYYKTGYNMDPKTIRPFPAGLRMIAGSMTSTAAQPYLDWECAVKYIPNNATIPTTCPVGDAVRLTVQFPQCWDGVNLDSPDHKSHMSYPDYRNPPLRSTCPASHPVPVPAITEHFDYPVTAASSPASWRLSSDMYSTSIAGGLSAHADWMDGWDQPTMNTIVSECLNKAVDCQVGMLNNGKEIY